MVASVQSINQPIVELRILPMNVIVLLQLEVDEILDVFLGAGRKALVLPDDLDVPGISGSGDLLVKEVGDIHLEDREDFEKCFQADLVFAVLHPT